MGEGERGRRDLEDREIIELFFARSEQAIDELNRKYGAAVRKVAFNILNHPGDTEECADDTYLAVWNTIPPRRPAPLLSYVCRIARNLALKRFHANTAEKRNSFYDAALDELAESVPAPETVETEYDAKELSAAVDAFLDTLGYDDRFLFVRRYWYADSVADLAGMTGRSPHHVSVRLSRVRKKLQIYLKKEGLL